MLVVHVRHVAVPVFEPTMLVRMGVGLPRRIIGPMLVAVMIVMYMRMRMLGELVLMLVFMGFSQVEPHSDCHE